MIRGFDGVLARIDELERMLNPAKGQAPTVSSAEGSFAAALDRVAERQAKAGPAARSTFDGLIREAAMRHGVNEPLIRAVVRAESDYNPRCVSHAGAMGLMQLMPENCREFGVSDPFDPAQNIDAGVRHLKQMLDTFGQLDLALAGYNAGPGAVRRYGGIPPYRETQAYVTKILGWLGEN